ncbi:Golgi CORVET complex core vacuolar protein 8-domain-containing protein [Auriculariales sp. MPI-PUGE-AT-0066]|nr:Golgi CORVET complex core vacuolar protein 8-domain-containing protein [Auriculariales sp. MPI-PUGE-AT-0066]
MSRDTESEHANANSPTGSDVDAGEYTAQLEEVMDSDDDEGFVYDGIDAPRRDYSEQLRDALSDEGEQYDDDKDDESAENEKEELAVEHNVGVPIVTTVRVDDDYDDELSNQGSELALSTRVLMSPRPDEHDRADSPAFSRPAFLHPTVSRLRSFTPRRSSSSGSIQSPRANDDSPLPSHFSAISTSSSLGAPQGTSTPRDDIDGAYRPFRWTVLRELGRQIHLSKSQKATEMLGAPGTPTVFTANGLICVGTTRGKTLVFDFKQQLRCICGSDQIAKTAGAVTALCLSNDHTFVAVGHETGHIYLYDLAKHQIPARTVVPTTLAAVSSGKKDGHLAGSRIVSLGFVGARHTAIVSADEHGLAFYHSLGQVLFVEATDTLRILGKYPITPNAPPPNTRRSSSILAADPLPLGPAPHPVDHHQLIALLTPSKLVIVGLKPQARTLHRVHREDEPNMRGCMAWFPSTFAHKDGTVGESANGSSAAAGATRPMIVFSWGRQVQLIRVREERPAPLPTPRKGAQPPKQPPATLVFEVGGKWKTDFDVVALQWLNVQQLVVLTVKSIEVYDIRTMRRVERCSFKPRTLIHDAGLAQVGPDNVFTDNTLDVARSVRSYKGKLFLLGQKEVQVGSLLSWADRILAHVREGRFLDAVDLCREYYVGEAPGNKLGLPDDPAALRTLVGTRLRELMNASADYAFSEERMHDGTHGGPGGQGVDRTTLFEQLVSVCARACMALDDFDFLFQELFEQYQEHLIAPIFLVQIEPFMLDGRIRAAPPTVTQQLIAYHEQRADLNAAEKVIWHIDPQCLDVDQAITLCERHGLYDALIYVYTRALRDYMSPLVSLLELVRKLKIYRRDPAHSRLDDDAAEKLTLNSYKVFTYLGNVLSGLTYPSQEPIPEDEAVQARKVIYTFMFYGRSSMWPAGDSGRLILTMEDESIPEPTYPYLRLLLRFDSESFLHALDIAFEDSYLNDDSRGIGRAIILRILLELVSSPTVPALTSTDETFVYIFIARNVPKYPQFIQLPPTMLHSVLIGLAGDPDETTREDRQLAAECLLSSYTPHDADQVAELFDEAGFFRILRSWHRRDGHYPELVRAYLRDPEIEPAELFESIEDILVTGARAKKGQLPEELVEAVMQSLPQILESGLTQTAMLVDTHMPRMHARVIEEISYPARQFAYLRSLLQPQLLEEEAFEVAPTQPHASSTKLDPESRHLYISLLCHHDPAGIISALESPPAETFDLGRALQICEEKEVFGAVIWIHDRQGDVAVALERFENVSKDLAVRLSQELKDSGQQEFTNNDLRSITDELQDLAHVAVSICQRHTEEQDIKVEDLWLQVLRSQMDVVQIVSSSLTATETEDSPDDHPMLEFMRVLVQNTFGVLLSQSRNTVSLSRLFKRLVDSSSALRSTSKSVYTEFKRILTATLETYKADGDALEITNRLLERDIFEAVEQLTTGRLRGWTARINQCAHCHKLIQVSALPPTTSTAQAHVTPKSGDTAPDLSQHITILRSGIIYHTSCYAALATSTDSPSSP